MSVLGESARILDIAIPPASQERSQPKMMVPWRASNVAMVSSLPHPSSMQLIPVMITTCRLGRASCEILVELRWSPQFAEIGVVFEIGIARHE